MVGSFDVRFVGAFRREVGPFVSAVVLNVV